MGKSPTLLQAKHSGGGSGWRKELRLFQCYGVFINYVLICMLSKWHGTGSVILFTVNISNALLKELSVTL